MNTQNHSSISHSILGSAKRLFRPDKRHGLLASPQISAHTLKDIGLNPIGLR